jgi:hypothetical protein
MTATEIMTIAEIKRLYDENINMTVKELSVITGRSVDELVFILTCTDEEY